MTKFEINVQADEEGNIWRQSMADDNLRAVLSANTQAMPFYVTALVPRSADEAMRAAVLSQARESLRSKILALLDELNTMDFD